MAGEMGHSMIVNPEIYIEGEFRIAADGTWYHENAPIERAALVRLFATLLVRDAEGAYWLQTPAEKIHVAVADAPFVAVELSARGHGENQHLRLKTNMERWVTLGDGHPLMVRGTEAAPRPYVALGGGLEAKLARAVYYQLADLALIGTGAHEGDPGVPGVWSQGRFFPLVPEAPATPEAMP